MPPTADQYTEDNRDADRRDYFNRRRLSLNVQSQPSVRYYALHGVRRTYR